MKIFNAPLWVSAAALWAATPVWAQFPGCPASDGSDLTDWRDAAADSYLLNNATPVRTAIEQCFATGIPACVARLNDILHDPRPSTALYPTAVDASLINPPEEFAVPGQPNSFKVPADFEDLWRAKGWRAPKFKTRGSGGFDSETSTLYILYVPGSSFTPALGYDRFIQFSLPTLATDVTADPIPRGEMPTADDYAREARREARLPSTFSMILMEKAADGHKARPYFQLFSRDSGGNPVFTRQSPSSETGCYSCHPNGLRAVSPLGYTTRTGETELPVATAASISFINGAMSSYGQIEWRSVVVPETGAITRFVKPELIGPPIGPMRPLTVHPSAPGETDRYPTRTQEYIVGADGTSGCAFSQRSLSVGDVFGRPGMQHTFTMSANPQVDWKKVKNAMNCAMCHNGQVRGTLNRDTDSSAVAFKVLVDQTMPLGAHDNQAHTDTLSEDERIALYNCLYEEEPVEYRSWLKEKTCNLNPQPAP